MKEYILSRAIDIANYILKTGVTVREASKHFNVSKSTVHKDVAERLREIDKELFEEVRKVLDVNLQERHLRGGMATKLKYQKKQNISM